MTSGVPIVATRGQAILPAAGGRAWRRVLGLTCLLGTLALRGASQAAAAPSEVMDGVAAIVNDKIITYSEVRDYVQPVAQQLRRDFSGDELREKVRAAQLDALNNLIDRALIVQEYHQKGYNIPETVVDSQLNETITTDFGGDRTAFIKTLEAQHLTLSQYREQVRDRVIVQAMRNRKAQQATLVSPYQIEKYYKEHLAEFKVEDRIKLRMIFVRKTPAPAPAGEAPAAPAPVASRRALAQEILAKLNEGDSFESLARLYSDGKEAKAGGEYGWISRDILLKDLSEVAFKLKPGQHSQIVETADGFYLLQVHEVSPTHTKPIGEVRAEIEKILLQQQRAKMQEEWVKDLRAKAFIRLF